jgi:spermidine synthase
VLAGHEDYAMPKTLPPGLRFLSLRNVGEMFVFPNDMLPVTAEVNRLNSQVLVHYYERDWKDIVH